MTDNLSADLVVKLRGLRDKDEGMFTITAWALDAADLLESQADRIAQLEREKAELERNNEWLRQGKNNLLYGQPSEPKGLRDAAQKLLDLCVGPNPVSAQWSEFPAAIEQLKNALDCKQSETTGEPK